ncbi:MAG: hypothetical protein HY874_11930 [Chloroflexi bacterium]|nr:hypothetical protein [Chloroflexota bacterium]
MSDAIDQRAGQAEAHRAAGEAAEAGTRWQDAVGEYEACLGLIAGAPEGAAPDEAAVLTALGRCYWHLAEARMAWRTLRRAISLYEARDDGVGQARATVEILQIWGPPERHRALAEAALGALGDADPYLRARLLLRLRWFDEDFETKFNEAMAIAEEHGFEDLLASRLERRAWAATDQGRTDEGVAFAEQAHHAYARSKAYESAAHVFRGVGYATIETGLLNRGFDLARRSFEYASGVNLRFNAQLALMDMIGVEFARGEFRQCEDLLALEPGASDFRADLYRMWIAEARGDMAGALGLMVQPERGGNTPTAMGQIHAAAAGILFRAGKEDAARQALGAWAEVRRQYEDDDYCVEAPAMLDCLVALGDEQLLRAVHRAFVRRDERMRAPLRFSTLQGRAVAPVRGAVAHKLGLLDEAQRHLREGLAWCSQEGCERDLALCRAGLGRLASGPSG